MPLASQPIPSIQRCWTTSTTTSSPIPAVLLVVALVLGAAGCDVSDHEDLVPTFEQVSISDKNYVQNLAIDSETLPAATGGDRALTYAISPDLPAGLAFDPATRLLSGTPTEALPATLYTYTATDSDAADPDSASLTFTITVDKDLVPTFEQQHPGQKLRPESGDRQRDATGGHRRRRRADLHHFPTPAGGPGL